jgi:AcrR family transcriptional regulator
MAPRPSKPTSPAAKKGSARLSKEKWLALSMAILKKRGPGALKIDQLTASLGVTKGSFYWHFGSSRKFLLALTEKWAQDYTYIVGDALAVLELPPRDKLRTAIQLIVENGQGGMDTNFRNLAIAYPYLASEVREVDIYRTRVITSLFEELGFEGDQLRIRVHTFVVLHSAEHNVHSGLSQKDLIALLDERLKFFTA